MGIENSLEGEPNIEALKEQFREELKAAADIPRELGGRAVFEDLESFQNLKDHPEVFKEVLEEEFGVEEKEGSIVREYEIEGTPGTEGEGKIKVRVFKTKEVGLFLREYTYQNGDKVFALTPDNLEDEE